MKIFAISDLHLSINNPKPMDIFGPVWENYLDNITDDWNKKVSDNDVVLLPGDLSWAMKLEDAKKDIDFISRLKGKKVIIRGNHDYWWSGINKVRKALPSNFFALQNDSVIIDDVIFCGTRGWLIDKNFISKEDQKILNREILRLEMSLKSAKERQTNNQKIICLMHYPPFSKNTPNSPFTDLIEKFNVDCVVFGHIHKNATGYKLIQTKNGIKYYLTSCDLIKNSLIEIIF